MRQILLLALFLTASTSLLADETFFLKGKAKTIKGAIATEDASGVTLSGSKKQLSPDDILDVEYEIKPLTVMIKIYRKAREKDKESSTEGLKENVRKVALAEAISKYEETIDKMSAGQDSARKQLDFRIAQSRARQTQEFGAVPQVALQKLEEFKTQYPNSWQLTPALRLIASLNVAQKKYKEAEAAYVELLKANISPEAKIEAEFEAAQIWVLAGNHALAMQKLQAIASKLPKNAPQSMRIQVAQAECLAASKKPKEANDILRNILTQTKDSGLKAMAYNTLGKNYFEQGLLKEARWEFLWVDVVYNEDPGEHAKALYYLSEIFNKLGERDRGQECRETLLSSPEFNGLEFQRRAQAEGK